MLGWPPRRSPWCIDGCSGIVMCWYVLLSHMCIAT
jgi:hypothetical protein